MGDKDRLAIDGGTPVRATPLQGGFHGSSEIDEEEYDAVFNVLRKKRLFRYLDEGEEESEAARVEAWYRERLGRRYALAVNSGTASLICAMYGVDAGPGDEVIIPAYTFVATAAAVIAAGAVPVIAEVDASLNMDPDDLRVRSRPTPKRSSRCTCAACPPVWTRSWRWRKVRATGGGGCGPVQRQLLQGAASGLYRRCGLFQLSTVQGGHPGRAAMATDEMIYDRARMEHDSAARFWEGKDSRRYDFVLSGANYRISELSAALFWAQRERLEPILAQCRAVKARIVAGLADVPGITLQDVPDPEGDCGITCTMFLPRADLAASFSRALNAENIRCGTVYDNTIADRHIYANWPFMMSGMADERRAPWKSPWYKGEVRGYSPAQCPRSLDYLGRAVMISIDQRFTLEDVDLVVEAVRKVAAALL